MSTPSTQNVEVEVKFLLPELDDVRARLQAIGAAVAKARVYERNVRFDDARESLRRAYKLLRLRQDTAAKLTFKGPPPDSHADSEAKAREELEIELSDFDTTAAILEKIGLKPTQVYEKYRETFQYESVEIVLDEMPYGNFVELEGREADIKELARRLDLNWDNRLVTDYLSLMGRLKAHHNLPFNDLTFENFEGLDVSIADVL